MAAEANYGLMLWDEQSRGTLTNIVHLVRQGKPVVVYIAPDKSFHTLRQSSQLAEMLGGFGPDVLHRIDRDLEAFGTDASADRNVDTAPLF